MRSRTRGFFYSTAMIDAFFSRVEHQFVLLLAFRGQPLANGELKEFRSSNWDEKLKKLIDVDTDKDAQKLLSTMSKKGPKRWFEGWHHEADRLPIWTIDEHDRPPRLVANRLWESNPPFASIPKISDVAIPSQSKPAGSAGKRRHLAARFRLAFRRAMRRGTRRRLSAAEMQEKSSEVIHRFHTAVFLCVFSWKNNALQ